MRPILIVGLAMTCSGVMLSGCAEPHANPSFPIEVADARELLGEMKDHPKTLQRPVVVLSGFLDPGWSTDKLIRTLKNATNPASPFLQVNFVGVYTFDGCAERVIAAVDKSHPSGDPVLTTEIDVVAVSMGGLVARHAARDRAHTDQSAASKPDASLSNATARNRRLNIHRLFTIGTPHCGAKLAKVPAFDQRVIDMKPGSQFLSQLNQTERSYELLPYVLLDDGVVGACNAAPPGTNPWWLPTPALHFSHIAAAEDHRILADIARRLRNESPITRSPPTPLPTQEPRFTVARAYHILSNPALRPVGKAFFRISKEGFRRIVS